jgi:hypothetical protein
MIPTSADDSVGDRYGLLPDPVSQPTMSVPDAGRLAYGISRPAAYEAAKRGEIPTIRIGRRLFVPTAKLLAMLGLGPSAQRPELEDAAR